MVGQRAAVRCVNDLGWGGKAAGRDHPWRLSKFAPRASGRSAGQSLERQSNSVVAALHRNQDRLLRLLGTSTDGRATVVKLMLHRDANESVSYWLQLVVSIGIATLGLVVGSTAVVIGAMLVAPLMAPIVGLAMGLATGSPFLVLRSSGRILISVVVAISGAAAITLLLPFHELNAEISARTSPTVLDLLTAAFCAIAGVYAALRPGSDTATTAAGTSIGISLVPPLCASGYGLGTTAWPVAGGAALLFLTNLVAIVAVGSVAFVAAGFNRVDVTALEREELMEGDGAPVARRLAKRLARLFESRGGPLLRLAMPFVLLAAVYVPLRRALDEVAWEVRVRGAVRSALNREPRPVVESRAQVARHAVDVVVVLLGKAEDAEKTRRRLTDSIERVAGIVPSVEVTAVPDATAFAGLESSLLTTHAVRAPPPPSPPIGEQLAGSGEAARRELLRLWPEQAAGAPLNVSFESSTGGSLVLRVAHWGPDLGAPAREALGTSLSEKLGHAVELTDLALPTEPVTRQQGDLDFVAMVADLIHASRLATGITVCVVRPDATDPKQLQRRDVPLAAALDRLLRGHTNVASVAGKSFSAQLARGACKQREDSTNADRPAP